MDQRKITREEAESGLLIDQVALRLERLGRELRPSQRADIKAMKLAELYELVQELRTTRALKDASNVVAKAIAHSQHALRTVKDSEIGFLDGGPANVMFF